MAKKTGSSRGSSQQRQESAQAVGRVTRARSQTPQPVHDASDSERPHKKSRTTQNEKRDLPPVDEDEHEDPEEAEVASLADPANTAQSVRSGISRYTINTVNTAFSQEELAAMDPQMMIDDLEDLTNAADQLTQLLLPKDRNQHAILRRELRNKGSLAAKRLEKRVTALENFRKDFGTTDYVKLDIVLRALLGVTRVEDISSGAWRPDPILYRVNIAQMLLAVCTADVDDLEEVDGDSKDALELLETYFPATIAGEAPHQGAFSLQLHLLIQLCILNLAVYKDEPTLNPHSIISDILFDTDPDHPGRFKYYNELNLSKLATETQTKYLKTFIGTAEGIKSIIGTEDDEVTPLAAARKLRAQYPWDDFVQRVGKYSNERIRELDGHIQLAGGMESIQKNLESEVNRRVYAKAADEKRQSLGRASGSSHRKLLGSAAELKQRALRQTQSAAGSAGENPNAVAEGSGRDIASNTPSTALPGAVVEDDWIAPPDDDYYNGNEAELAEDVNDEEQVDDADADNVEASASILKSAAGGNGAAEPGSMRALLSTFGDQGHRQNAAKGKSFVDRQQGATRVSFEDESQTQRPSNTQRAEPPRASSSSAAQASEPRPRQQPAPRSPAKRTHDEMEEDDDDDFEPTQDTGFQTDRRDITAAADERRRAAPRQQPVIRASASQQPEPPRVFSAFAQPAATAGSAPRNPSPPPAVRRNNPGNSVPAYNPDHNRQSSSAPGENGSWAEIVHSAGTLSRIRTASEAINKEPRARTPWTEEEDNALFNLMEQHGIAYSAIKSADMSDGGGNVLVLRSAEDIRFRARNNKFKLLKSGYTMDRLPPGLEKVPLQKSQIDQLLRMGVDVRQDRQRAPAQR